MNGTAYVTLPAGLWVDGVCQREAELRPLIGNDEALLLEKNPTLLPAEQTTLQITRCLTRLGSIDQITPNIVRSLTVGDREALLLHLRRLTFGDTMQCTVNCPNLNCGERMDIDLRVSDLLLPPYSEPRELYERTINQNDVACKVRFRLPTGGDQEEVATLAMSDPEAAVDLLIKRCVEKVTTEEDVTVELESCLIADQLSRLMFELDPQAEVKLNLACPYCGQSSSALLDASTFFFQELIAVTRHLYKDVHLLAFYYHWSETEILGMTSARRRRYLDLLEEELKDLGHQ
jgi:hypothetical protein